MFKIISKISVIGMLLSCYFMGDSIFHSRDDSSPFNQALSQKRLLSQQQPIDSNFGSIPLYFVPNEGQVDSQALFFAKATNYTLWLTKSGLIFDNIRNLKSETGESRRQNLRESENPADSLYERDISNLVFINANRNPEVNPVDIAEHEVNYFFGNDRSKWRTKIQTSRAILYKDLYDNIDLKVYGIKKQIEYDFVVKPGGEISDICFEYRGVIDTKLDTNDNLVVRTNLCELTHTKPVCYQVIGGERIDVTAGFQTIDNQKYGFKVEAYNNNFDLIIDPVVLVYSSYLGGSGDEVWSEIAVDKGGATYISGTTYSPNFPTKDPIQGSKAIERDVFVAKINSERNSLVYSTYLGGSGEDDGNGISVDSNGAVYLTGTTWSPNFPTKAPLRGYAGHMDAFITKIGVSGSDLVYSTCIGGSFQDSGADITVDSDGAAYVTGYTYSDDFPTRNPIQKTRTRSSDVFICKIAASGKTLVYSTYLGGSSFDFARGIEVDTKGAVCVVGLSESSDFPTTTSIQPSYAGDGDAIIFKLNTTGTALTFSTYLGGSGCDHALAIALDSEGLVYLTGYTESIDFPILNPMQNNYGGGDLDAFIVKLDATGSDLKYSTYLGGSGYDVAYGIALDSGDSIFVSGETDSVDFPTFSPIYSNHAGELDAFVAALSTSGSAFKYSTFLGGSGDDCGSDIAVDSEGAAYVTGMTESVDFPVLNPVQSSLAGGSDAFIAKIGAPVDRLRIVSWNILDYPDLNGEPREEYYKKVLESLSPDILIVQEMNNSFGVDEFLKKVLKSISKKYRASKFIDGPDTDNVLFYDRTKIRVMSNKQIYTSLRDISEYSLKIKKNPGKGVKFKLFSVNFPEGLSASDKAQRETDALAFRNYLDGFHPDEVFIVCGTLNMISSQEKAFKILSKESIDNIGRLKDPMNKVGKWHDKRRSRFSHTESTRKLKLSDGAKGGLDDRYDMILLSYSLLDNEKLIYRSGSYQVYGNDGKHLNKAINSPKNKIVSFEIADALYNASDHLPVVIELIAPDKSK